MADKKIVEIVAVEIAVVLAFVEYLIDSMKVFQKHQHNVDLNHVV